MALDPRKRQKKLQRRKEKEKKRETARGEPPSLAAQFERAAALAPILHCCTITDLWENGMGHVLVSRQLSNGLVAFVVFLVDVYCLGVKNVMMDIAARSRYQREVYDKMVRSYQVVRLKPECARKLVERVVQYALDLGLPPHSDYRTAKLIFGDIDAAACTEEFVFGKDGKPYFFAGPHDSPARCQQIIGILTSRCGRDGFHFTIPGQLAGILPVSLSTAARTE